MERIVESSLEKNWNDQDKIYPDAQGLYIKIDFSRNKAQTSEMLRLFISLILLWNMDIVLEWCEKAGCIRDVDL